MSLACFAALTLAIAAQPLELEGPNDDPVINVRDTDAEMNAAKAKGRSTLPEFLERLAKPAANETGFLIKFDVDPTDRVEFVWARVTGRSGPSLAAILVNDTANTSLRYGDRVVVPQSEIIDWGFRRNGVMQGNFTTRVLVDRLPFEEAAEARAFLGW